MPVKFELQGHRGARGLKPENTLPSFEVAFDLGVSAVETDIHLSCDGVPIVMHDAVLNDRLFRVIGERNVPAPRSGALISSLTVDQLRGYQAIGNPHPERFPQQDPSITPLAALFCRRRGLDPYAPPTLAELLEFTSAYAGDLGQTAGKSERQRSGAARLCFDLELKRVPFHPEVINDDFDGNAAGRLELAVVEAVRSAGAVDRTIVRSFDHRSVRAVRRVEPGLTGAILVTGTAPVALGALAREAGAQIYCPDYLFLDALHIRHAHAEGLRVVPWTVNDLGHCKRLIDWGVDGITTDFPDRLADLLHRRGLEF